MIVPKGDIYDIRYFDAKEEVFKSNHFLDDVKHMYTDFINDLVQDESEKLTVFDRSGPYLATKKIGKNNPKEAEIKAANAVRQEWNQTVDEALVLGVSREELVKAKKENIGQKVKESVELYGKDPGRFLQILTSAIHVLRDIMEKWKMPSLARTEIDIEEFQRMQKVYNKLLEVQKSIRIIDQKISDKNKKLEAISGILGMFKVNDKVRLMNEISELTASKKKYHARLATTVSQAGYRNVDGFMKMYRKSEALVKEYQADSVKKAGAKTKKRESVVAKLRQYEADSKRVTVSRNTKRKNYNVDIE